MFINGKCSCSSVVCMCHVHLPLNGWSTGGKTFCPDLHKFRWDEGVDRSPRPENDHSGDWGELFNLWLLLVLWCLCWQSLSSAFTVPRWIHSFIQLGDLFVRVIYAFTHLGHLCAHSCRSFMHPVIHNRVIYAFSRSSLGHLCIQSFIIGSFMHCFSKTSFE